MKLSRTAMIALGFGAVASACGGDLSTSTPASTVSPEDDSAEVTDFSGTSLAVFRSASDDSAESADVSGEIVEVNGCIGVDDAALGPVILVLPHNRIELDPELGASFVNPDGVAISLALGQTVVVGGDADGTSESGVEFLNLPCELGPNVVVTGLYQR